MSMGCVSIYHPGGEWAPVFALGWTLRAVEVHSSTLVLGIRSANDSYSSGLLVRFFKMGLSTGDAYHVLQNRNWLYTTKSISA